MPRLNGLAALRMIKAELPETRIVMLTMSAEDDELFEAIAAGASGYLLKTQDTDEVFALLQDVARGEVALSPGLASRVLNEFRRRASRPARGRGEAADREPLAARDAGPHPRRAGAHLQGGRREAEPLRAHDQVPHGRDRRPAAPREPRPGDPVRPARGHGPVARAPPRTAPAPCTFSVLDCPPGTWSGAPGGVSTVAYVLTVVLYGNSLALSGVGASLEAHPGLRIVRVDAVDTSAEALRRLEPDVVVFDLATAQPGRGGLWTAAPAGPADRRGPAEHQVVVFSGESARALTTDDLLRVIESRMGPGATKPRPGRGAPGRGGEHESQGNHQARHAEAVGAGAGRAGRGRREQGGRRLHPGGAVLLRPTSPRTDTRSSGRWTSSSIRPRSGRTRCGSRSSGRGSLLLGGPSRR